MLFLDLDQFKSINDQYGHDVGDLLIQEVAERLRKFISARQFAYRIGGDEFLVIIEDQKFEYITKLAEDILQSIKEIYYIDGNELYMTVSMGIVIGDAKIESSSSLLKKLILLCIGRKHMGKIATVCMIE